MAMWGELASTLPCYVTLSKSLLLLGLMSSQMDEEGCINLSEARFQWLTPVILAT
jgi:hypothetical protein